MKKEKRKEESSVGPPAQSVTEIADIVAHIYIYIHDNFCYTCARVYRSFSLLLYKSALSIAVTASVVLLCGGGTDCFPVSHHLLLFGRGYLSCISWMNDKFPSKSSVPMFSMVSTIKTYSLPLFLFLVAVFYQLVVLPIYFPILTTTAISITFFFWNSIIVLWPVCCSLGN